MSQPTSKTVYLAGEAPQTQPRNVSTVYPAASVGAEFGATPIAQVRLIQKGDVSPLLDQELVMGTMIVTNTAQTLGIGAGIAMIHGEQVPPSTLQPLRRAIEPMAGGRIVTIDIADQPEKNPIDDVSYQVDVVIEYLERCPEVDALNQPDVARRIYADALEANLPNLNLDIARYVDDPDYSLLNELSPLPF